jgi:hypothetical protein
LTRSILKAAKVLSRKNKKAKLTVIEKNSKICRKIEKLGLKTVCMDGIKYLDQNLKNLDYPDWIIPAIPVHVAYEWVRLKKIKFLEQMPIIYVKALKYACIFSTGHL